MLDTSSTSLHGAAAGAGAGAQGTAGTAAPGIHAEERRCLREPAGRGSDRDLYTLVQAVVTAAQSAPVSADRRRTNTMDHPRECSSPVSARMDPEDSTCVKAARHQRTKAVCFQTEEGPGVTHGNTT